MNPATHGTEDNASVSVLYMALELSNTSWRLAFSDGAKYRTRDEARADVFEYIERFYNPRRRHSTLGQISPMEFERQNGS